MKSIFESVIARGGYDLSGLLKRIDTYHIEGKLTDAEKEELYRKARGSANPSANLDLMAKLVELESRVKRLEEGQPEQPEPGQTPADYVAGKWYYTGNKVTFNGAVYTCVAPEGQVCTWSPAEYPAYWEAE